MFKNQGANDSFMTIMNSATYPHVLILGGPTSSGKSALALDLARRMDGVLINADSMQLYREIPILSGQPTLAEQSAAPHELYGVLPVTRQASAAFWQKMAEPTIASVLGAGKLPIVVGGTGLYIRALIDGLSDMPDIDSKTRDAVQAIFDFAGVDGLHRELSARDPKMAARLHATDRQRMARALEVVMQTGQSLAEYQGKRAAGKNWDYKIVNIIPDRAELYARCNARFDQMIENGALDEARAIEEMNPQPDSTAIKAKGIPELRAYLRGEMDRETAIATAKTKTRQYAKRQYTWFRNQTNPDITIDRIVTSNDAENIGRMVMQSLFNR